MLHYIDLTHGLHYQSFRDWNVSLGNTVMCNTISGYVCFQFLSSTYMQVSRSDFEDPVQNLNTITINYKDQNRIGTKLDRGHTAINQFD